VKRFTTARLLPTLVRTASAEPFGTINCSSVGSFSVAFRIRLNPTQ
jgi:hypothetical protein